MKPTAYIIAGMFIIASMTASCNSCNKKHDNQPDNATMTTTEPAADTTITADASEPAVSTATEKTGSAKASVKNSADKNKDGKEGGYSAADGTEAENHDGDQYTKNDQKPMPTGPPMK